MTKANLRLLLLAGAAASSLAASAQTATHHATASTAHHPVAAKPAVHSDCVVEPTLSPKIPAVPAGTPCPKSMVAISEDIQFSPLVGPELRSSFPNLPNKFSLDYQDLQLGTGEVARPHMYYTVKYTGYLLDGSKFDASDDHAETKGGISFPYGAHRVIPGWDLGFEGMHIGGKRRLFIPYQLAYGERGRPPAIPAKSELIFDMELVAQSATDPNAPPTPPSPPAGAPGATPAPGAPPSPNGAPGATPPQASPDVKPTPPAGTAPATTPQPTDSKPQPPTAQ